MEKTCVELFAGVGGIRIGLENSDLELHNRKEWQTMWFSQWEPGKKNQFAHKCYVDHYGDLPDDNGVLTTGDDIATVDKHNIPDHNLLTGGFPCQDYSVAHSLTSSRGIEGKKGVLWWQIRDILIVKRPPFVLLENVDRLLKSPATQRGRDFGMILTSFAQLGYRCEWRVVNAADYGAAQRRRRTFIFAYQQDTAYAHRTDKLESGDIITKNGFMANAFPIAGHGDAVISEIPITDVSRVDRDTLLDEGTEQTNSELLSVSKNFAFGFLNAGYMINGRITTMEIIPQVVPAKLLRDIVQHDVDEKYYIPEEAMKDWAYMKGAKKIERTAKNGHKYVFSEGAIAFPDPLDRPGRTMLTSEGTKNRSTHVIADPGTGRLRILTPIECERLQGFPDNWTDTGMTDRQRRFCMGNALVTDMIKRMANVLDPIFKDEP